MVPLDALDKDIVRAWSAVVAGGGDGTPVEVVARLGLVMGAWAPAVPDVERRMRALRSSGALPEGDPRPIARLVSDAPERTLPVMTNPTDPVETADTLPAPAVPPRCTGWRCTEDGTIDSGDFGLVCRRCMNQIENTVGT